MLKPFAFRNKKGFTLIELLIVITIIGILAVALIPRVSQGPAKARDSKRLSDLNNISTALELYYSDIGTYPYGTLVPTTMAIPICLTATSSIATSLANYLQAIPKDPTSTNTIGTLCSGTNAGNYGYYAIGSGTTTGTTASSYALIAKMETANTSASDNFYCLSAIPAPADLSSYSAAATWLRSSAKLAGTACTTDTYYVILH